MGVLTLLLVFLRLPGVPFFASRNGEALPLQTVINARNRFVFAVAVHPACGSTRPATRSRKIGLVCPGVSEHVR